MGDHRQTATAHRPAPAIPYVRASEVLPFVKYCRANAMPVDRLVQTAKLPASPLRHGDALVPLHACYRFLDAVARHAGSPGIGAEVAQGVSVFALGALGRGLHGCTTVLDYLLTGSRLVGRHSNSGMRIWLSFEGDTLRVSQRVVDGEGQGPAIADSYTLALTLKTLRQWLGPDWAPDEVTLRGDTERGFRQHGLSMRTAVTGGAAHSSFTLPLSLLSTRIDTTHAADSHRVENGRLPASLPDSFTASLEHLVRLHIAEGEVSVAAVAASAGLRERTLQRRLAGAGTSFNALLARCRSERARQLLSGTDLPVIAIAAELGYTDASNFSRAFSRENGVAPLLFRRLAQQKPAGQQDRAAGAVAEPQRALA